MILKRQNGSFTACLPAVLVQWNYFNIFIAKFYSYNMIQALYDAVLLVVILLGR